VERLPVEGRDRRLLELLLRRAESLHFLGRRQEIVDLLLQHRDRVERLADPSLAGQYYFWLGFAHAFLGHRAEAGESLRRGLEEATRSGDRALMGRVHRALNVECTFSGRPLDEAISHAREAVALLEGTEDRFWLSQALFSLGYSCHYAGEFDAVLEAMARLDALGQTMGSRRARANAAMLTGFTRATRGDWAAGVEALERAREFSPDAFETAYILACLGKAHAESGDAVRAIPLLEEAVQLADQVRSRQYRQWFRALLGEACLQNGRLDRARELASQALDGSTTLDFALGIGWSHQVLGRVALAKGALGEAERHLTEALRTFDAIRARFEAGRSHLFLAGLAGARGDREAATAHLRAAHALFTVLRCPRLVERVEALARELGGVSL
jgi:tetratricopeptide (TPR) repeat protein